MFVVVVVDSVGSNIGSVGSDDDSGGGAMKLRRGSIFSVVWRLQRMSVVVVQMVSESGLQWQLGFGAWNEEENRKINGLAEERREKHTIGCISRLEVCLRSLVGCCKKRVQLSMARYGD